MASTYTPQKIILGILYLILASLFSICVRFAFIPNLSALWGIAAVVCFVQLIYLLEYFTRLQRWLFAIATAQLFQWIVFPWIYNTLINIGHFHWAWALVLSAAYGLVFQAKIVFALLLPFYLMRRFQMSLLFFLPPAAVLSDMLPIQIMPWFWGNLAGNDYLVKQFASFGGVISIGWIYLIMGIVLHTWFRAVLIFLNRKISIIRHLKLLGDKTNPSPNPTGNTQSPIVFGKRNLLLVGFLMIIYIYGIAQISYWQNITNNKNISYINIGVLQTNTGPNFQNPQPPTKYAQNALSQLFSLGYKSLQENTHTLDALFIPESAVPYHGIKNTKENQNKGTYSKTMHSILAFLAHYGTFDTIFNQMNYANGKLFNEIRVLGPSGELSKPYRKNILFPFGEYIPLENIFPWLRKIFSRASRYHPGDKKNILSMRIYSREKNKSLPVPTRQWLAKLYSLGADFVYQDTPIKPLVRQKINFVPFLCYEGIWPDFARHFFTNSNAQILVNLANDTWFGKGWQPMQHLMATHFRSIELGRYMIRVGLAGPSAVIDPTGHIHFLAPLFQPAIGTARVAIISTTAKTIYSRGGHWLNHIALIIFALFILKTLKHRKKLK